jgi:hypothetical protein
MHGLCQVEQVIQLVQSRHRALRVKTDSLRRALRVQDEPGKAKMMQIRLSETKIETF